MKLRSGRRANADGAAIGGMLVADSIDRRIRPVSTPVRSAFGCCRDEDGLGRLLAVYRIGTI